MAQTSEFYTKAKVDELLGAVDMANIVDSHGNKRFVEGEGTPRTIEGLTITYNKWSLSGTHLMLVLAGTIENGVEIPKNQEFVTYTLPSYIANKIVALWDDVYVDVKIISLRADAGTKQDLSILLLKATANRLGFYTPESITLTAERHYRIQFDLLIDSE